MLDDIFGEGFSTDTCWWDAAPRPQLAPRPLYSGSPRFLPAIMGYYNLLDRIELRRR